ncbi:hypothetical protein CHS0354_040760 [Potamilus streckersoni]|uniref:Uncharacterized protein n=1 Tax=Potamilus streckersoni TaxID=2493646 RepID=A0AAE0VXA5_9BIVA|nr:hypothetical protein CHS0354_040760 [Potamilus streckersoni]
MNTIAVLILCILVFAVFAQYQDGDLKGLKHCPGYFCGSGECGLFATVSYHNGGQCRCPCFGFGGGSGGNGIRNCPRSYCYNGQCGHSVTYSRYRYQRCRCHCSGYYGYRGKI